MRFLLDESAEARIAGFLTDRGHDATRVGRDYPAGLPDEAVLAIVQSEQRIVITNDKDFGELVFRERHPHAGVIPPRQHGPAKDPCAPDAAGFPSGTARGAHRSDATGCPPALISCPLRDCPQAKRCLRGETACHHRPG